MRDSLGVWLVLQDPHFAGSFLAHERCLLYAIGSLDLVCTVFKRFLGHQVQFARSTEAHRLLLIRAPREPALRFLHESASFYAVPGILLLASLAGLAVVLYLQQKQVQSNGHSTNGHDGMGEPVDGGTAFVEDSSGLQVRRSKRHVHTVQHQCGNCVRMNHITTVMIC